MYAGGDGTSWDCAYSTVSEALNKAREFNNRQSGSMTDLGS